MYKSIQTVNSVALGALMLVCVIINFSFSQVAYAQTSLCPDDFSEGAVTTGFVECYESSSHKSQRGDAEVDRLELEAACLAEPRSEVSSSQIRVTSSGRFYAQLTCTIRRVVPSGTTLCPADTAEIYRAFESVICRNYGMAETTIQLARAAVTQDRAECRNLGGSVVDSIIERIDSESGIFYSTTATCRLDTRAVDPVICPFGFSELSDSDTQLICGYSERGFETLTEAEAGSVDAQAVCTGTTSGLGSVTEVQAGATSGSTFFATVECTVNIPRYSDFVDDRTIRACNASCTERVRETRVCLNGGTIGGPGCLGPSARIVDRRCHTGPDITGLCPLITTPSIIPLLLFEEEES